MSKIFAVFLLLAVSLCFGGSENGNLEGQYCAYAVNKPSSVYNFRINIFSSFFGDSLLSFEKNGFFLFFEKMGTQRLFFFNNQGRDALLTVYQLPAIDDFPWLNPSRYMARRNQSLKSYRDKNRCIIKTTLNSSEVDFLRLDKQFYLVPENSFKDGRKQQDYLAFDDVILGFSQKDAVRRYFYFKKINKKYNELPKSFFVYLKMFEVLDHMNSNFLFPECR